MNCNFWDISKTSLQYLSDQLDKMPPLSIESNHPFRNFETTQKVYLNSCKKLVSLHQDGLIEKSQKFIQQRKEYQEETNKTINSISKVFFEFPQKKCYFSLEFIHAFFAKETFPFMVKSIDKYCQQSEEIQKKIMKALLRYELPKNYKIEVNQQVTINCQFYSVSLDYFEDNFYLAVIAPQQSELFELSVRFMPGFLKNQLNILGEIIKEIQKEEYFLNYIVYFIENMIKQIQYTLTINKMRGINNKIIIEVHQSIQDFLDQKKTHLILKSKSYFLDQILMSNNNYYLLLHEQFESDSQIIHYKIDDNLEQLLIKILNLEQLKQQYQSNLKEQNRQISTYFPLPIKQDTYSNEDQDIDIIFKITECYCYSKQGDFILAYTSEDMNKLQLWIQKDEQFIKILTSIKDQLQLIKLEEEELENYIRWMIVRNCAFDISPNLGIVKVQGDELHIHQHYHGKKFVSILNQKGFLSQELTPLIHLLDDYRNYNSNQILDSLESLLFDTKYMYLTIE